MRQSYSAISTCTANATNITTPVTSANAMSARVLIQMNVATFAAETPVSAAVGFVS